MMARPILWLGLLAWGVSTCAQAVVINIVPGPRVVYLRVGDGAFNSTYLFGGTPGNDATVNEVSVTVPAAALGNGVSQPMTSNGTQAASHYDGRSFCSLPSQVYVGGFYRRPGLGGGSRRLA